MNTRPHRLARLLPLSVLLFAGCNGDDTGSESETQASTTSMETETETETETSNPSSETLTTSTVTSTTTMDPTVTTTDDPTTDSDTEGTMTDPTTGDPVCNNDLVCDEAEGEDPENCLHDCGTCNDNGSCEATENPFSCPGDCPVTECVLDGELDPLTEQCDDGAETADCNTDCSVARCGDGILNQTAGEECDDGDDLSLGCTAECGLEERVVFITSQNYPGNLGSLGAADAHCQGLAAGLSGGYMAWLSDTNTGPASRFGIPAAYKGRFVLTNGTVIAEGWQDLTDGTLAAPITVDEKGAPAPSLVWTNTTPAGMPGSQGSCNGWTSLSSLVKGGAGAAEDGFTDAQWTQFEGNSCASSARLYCFQVN